MGCRYGTQVEVRADTLVHAMGDGAESLVPVGVGGRPGESSTIKKTKKQLSSEKYKTPELGPIIIKWNVFITIHVVLLYKICRKVTASPTSPSIASHFSHNKSPLRTRRRLAFGHACLCARQRLTCRTSTRLLMHYRR